MIIENEMFRQIQEFRKSNLIFGLRFGHRQKGHDRYEILFKRKDW